MVWFDLELLSNYNEIETYFSVNTWEERERSAKVDEEGERGSDS